MDVYTYPLGPLQTNGYLVVNQATGQALIIDPGMNPGTLVQKAKEYQVKAILLTHGHFDHMGGVEEVRQTFKAPLYIHPVEQSFLQSGERNLSSNWFGAIVTSPAEKEYEDGDFLEVAGFKIKVLHTPGHTPGSVSLLIGENLFSGDTLFERGIGRTDLPGGSFLQIKESIFDKLFTLPDDIKVYPGHGSPTTVGREKEENPFFV